MKTIFNVIYLVITLLFSNSALAQSYKDSVIVGKVISTDPISFSNPSTRYGPAYYYGVHHCKIVKKDLINPHKLDTIIIAMVYNMATEMNLYKRNFNIKVQKTYIFHLMNFTPNKSDFIRLNGSFLDDMGLFAPYSNKLINKYHSIDRIIYFVPFIE